MVSLISWRVVFLKFLEDTLGTMRGLQYKYIHHFILCSSHLFKEAIHCLWNRLGLFIYTLCVIYVHRIPYTDLFRAMNNHVKFCTVSRLGFSEYSFTCNQRLCYIHEAFFMSIYYNNNEIFCLLFLFDHLLYVWM